MKTEISSDVSTDALLDFLVDLMRFRRRLMAMLPEDVARVRERLADKLSAATAARAQHWAQSQAGERAGDRSDPGNRAKRILDNDLFYRIAVIILSRRQEPVSMGELSKALVVPLSTATRIVDGLVASGVAERIDDPEDRRVVRVTLSAEGQELYQVMSEYLRQRIEQLMVRFTSEERDQFVRLLRKAMDSIIAEGPELT
jgi:DNA-binding MarR family transcriptional regulator